MYTLLVGIWVKKIGPVLGVNTWSMLLERGKMKGAVPWDVRPTIKELQYNVERRLSEIFR